MILSKAISNLGFHLGFFQGAITVTGHLGGGAK